MRLEVLHVQDCPNLPLLLERLVQVTDLPVTTRVIESDADAARFGMAGSPTLLVDGVDPFEAADIGVSCRLYRDADGRIVDVPSVEQLRAAITPTAVLSAWRRRALPMDVVERAVHQAILRSFAATGRPPIAADRGTAAVLRALHDMDAIRLSPHGEIAVAYPFSATPTRHRVRLGNGVEVYAMCAVDALGIGPMLGQDTVISSVDVTNDQPITVTSRHGRRTWEPSGVVVFVGADAGGGPSADCCCDYLNFFTDRGTANAWRRSHPQLPGQVLDQPDAELLATRLFAHLLADN
jgi:hypothetical protein